MHKMNESEEGIEDSTVKETEVGMEVDESPGKYSKKKRKAERELKTQLGEVMKDLDAEKELANIKTAPFTIGSYCKWRKLKNAKSH